MSVMTVSKPLSDGPGSGLISVKVARNPQDAVGLRGGSK
jgi:hypothetical protein